MKEKRNALTFTAEDRKQVFERLRGKEDRKGSWQRLAPMVVVLFMMVIGGVLLRSFVTDTNVAKEMEKVPVQTTANGVEEVKTVLLSLKDSAGRVPINVLLAIDEPKQAMNVVSISRDTYAEVGVDAEGQPLFDKLTFAYSMGGENKDSVAQAVAKLFSVTIDEAHIIDLLQLDKYVEQQGGVAYKVPENVSIRAIEQAVFELEKGTQQLSGEQLAALLLMATTNVIDASEQKQLAALLLQQLATLSKFVAHPIESYTIETISLHEGMQPGRVNESYVVRMEPEFIKQTVESLYDFSAHK